VRTQWGPDAKGKELNPAPVREKHWQYLYVLAERISSL
jgi:hypothetical protein